MSSNGTTSGIEERHYGRVPSVLDMPHLVSTQLESFERFKNEYLQETVRRDLAHPGLHREEPGASLRGA